VLQQLMKARVVAEKQDGVDEKRAKDKKAVLPTRQTSLLHKRGKPRNSEILFLTCRGMALG
jgi:hypothetical protein